MKTLHIILSSFLILNSFFVSYSINPIESLLFLIFSFCVAAVLLLTYSVEFLGLAFIIIYVGAIAILFIFVIMMLNIKNIQEQDRIIFVLGSYMTGFGILVVALSSYNEFSPHEQYVYFKFLYDIIGNTNLLGQVIYNEYTICFLIGGLLLLIALIGAIVLTLELNKTKIKQKYIQQLSRSDKNAIRLMK